MSAKLDERTLEMKQQKMTRAKKIAAAALAAKPAAQTDTTAKVNGSETGPTTAPEIAKPTETSAPSEAKPDPLATLAAEASKLLKTDDTAFVITRNRDPHTMEEDAYRWMNNPRSIPGVPFAPIQFVGKKCLRQHFEHFKRLITLQEVQEMVQTDGKMEQCWITKNEFQPVRYMPFLSHDAEDDLKNGVAFAECRHYFGGAFTLFYGNILATSGSVYEPNGEDYCGGSPLIIAEQLFTADNKKHGRKKSSAWPESRQQVIDYIQRKTGRVDNRKNLRSVAETALAAIRNSRGPKDLNSALAALKLETSA